MENTTKVQTVSKPKTAKVNYTPYRKMYNQAKSVLVQNHKDEFKKILAGLLPKKAETVKVEAKK